MYIVSVNIRRYTQYIVVVMYVGYAIIVCGEDVSPFYCLGAILLPCFVSLVSLLYLAIRFLIINAGYPFIFNML